MYKAEKVKIDVDMVERYMALHNLTKGEFSQKMGHTRSWWCGIVKYGGYIMPAKAKLMCNLMGMDYNKLVIPEHTTSNALPQSEKHPLYADDESIQGLVNSMTRIEKMIGEQAMNMTRMEIQMRTILKELGVK